MNQFGKLFFFFVAVDSIEESHVSGMLFRDTELIVHIDVGYLVFSSITKSRNRVIHSHTRRVLRCLARISAIMIKQGGSKDSFV